MSENQKQGPKLQTNGYQPAPKPVMSQESSKPAAQSQQKPPPQNP